MSSYILNAVFIEYTKLPKVVINIIFEYELLYINSSILIHDFVLPILNDMYFTSNICNHIISDYLRFNIKFDRIADVCLKSILIIDDIVYGVSRQFIYKFNITKNKIKFIINFPDDEDYNSDSGMLITSNLPLAIINEQLYNVRTNKYVPTKVKLYYKRNDYKYLYDQYWFDGIHLYIRDTLELKKYTLDGKLVYADTIPNLYSMYFDMSNSDMYNVDKHSISVTNHNTTERILEVWYIINVICVYNDELYVISNSSILYVYDKLTFCIIYKYNLSVNNVTELAVSNQYIIIYTKYDGMYIMNK